MANFRNKKLVVTIRVILGLIFLMSGVTGLMAGFSGSMQGIPPAMIPAMQIFWHSGILEMIKTTEVIAGLMFILGFRPALAAIFVAPICVGVIIFNAIMMPAYVVTGIIISVLNIYLGYAYWDKYKMLFTK